MKREHKFSFLDRNCVTKISINELIKL